MPNKNLSARFINHSPQFYIKTYHKNTLFGSQKNNFTVGKYKSFPIHLNKDGFPSECKILTSNQKEYIENKFKEIKHELRSTRYHIKNIKLSEKLRDINNKLHEWREKVTTVKVEDGAIENTES